MDLQDAHNLSRYSSGFSGESAARARIEDSDFEEPENTETKNSLSKLFGESLPVLATSNDAREVVRFLRNKPSGLSFAEILSLEPRRIFEPRKIEAYESWGIIQREGERIKLTALGNKLSEMVASENEIFEEVLSSIPIYVEIIKWIDRQKIKLVTHPDINDFFTQLQQKGQYIKISEAEVVSFFSICHAAELGVATVGKRGQPARLRVDSRRIEEFLSGDKSKPKAVKFNFNQRASSPYSLNGQENYPKSSIIQRVYISGAPDTKIAENLYGALELADFESIIFNEDEKDDYLQSGRLQKMHLCQAGVIIINDEDCFSDSNEKTVIKSERLTETTAAAGLFNWRIVIIWNSELPIPDYLQSYNLQLLVNDSDNFKLSYQTVKLLKEMKYLLINQIDS
jgi:hypothetical protein